MSGNDPFRARGESKRNRENRKLMRLPEAFEREPQELREGRITALLRKRGYTCGENRVAKLMRSMGLQGRRRKGYRVTAISHSHRKFPNLLNQNFRCEKPNASLAPISPIFPKEKVAIWLLPWLLSQDCRLRKWGSVNFRHSPLPP